MSADNYLKEAVATSYWLPLPLLKGEHYIGICMISNGKMSDLAVLYILAVAHMP